MKAVSPVEITAGGYTAKFAAGKRLRCVSLFRDELNLFGDEGAPFIAPWFGRLPSTGYMWEGRRVEVGGCSDVEVDGAGLPLHGVINRGWRFTQNNERSVTATCDGYHPVAFPFRSRFRVNASVSEHGLLVETLLFNDEAFPVPVGFGWHPYFNVDAVNEIAGPFEQSLVMEDGLPTGGMEACEVDRLLVEPMDAVWERNAIGQYTLEGNCGDIVVGVGNTFRWVVTWIPEDRSSVCVEPVVSPPGISSPAGGVVVGGHQEYRASFYVK